MKLLSRLNPVAIMCGVGLAAAVAVVSCYTIKSIEMPSAVKPGEEFTVRAAIVNDQGEDKDLTGYAVFGIRVPEDWEVTMPENAYEYCDGGEVKGTASMLVNEIVTDILNFRYAEEGYKWLGFTSGTDGDPKIKRSLKGDCSDEIAINVLLTAGTATGDYELEFVFGDEEDGFNKYANNLAHDPQSDPRLFHVGTFTPDPTKENQEQYKLDGFLNPVLDEHGNPIVQAIKPSIQNSREDINTMISVTDGAGVATLAADSFEIIGGTDGCIHVRATGADAMNAIVEVYDAAGVRLDMKVLSSSDTALRAAKGVCVVKVLKGGMKSVRKVFVK